MHAKAIPIRFRKLRAGVLRCQELSPKVARGSLDFLKDKKYCKKVKHQKGKDAGRKEIRLIARLRMSSVRGYRPLPWG